MKLNKTMLVALLAGMALCGCQKDDDAVGEKNEGINIKKKVPLIAIKKTNDNGCIYVFYFKYDMQWRQISMFGSSENNESYEKIEISYDGSKIIEYKVDEIEQVGLSRETEGVLNSNGLVTTGIIRSLKTGEQGTINCKYDENGFLVYKKESSNSGNTWEVHAYTIQDGNIVKEEISYSSGYISKRTYSYYMDKLNTIGPENMGVTFYGKQSKNLIKSERRDGETMSYIYEFDSKNRVVRQQCSEGWYHSFTYVE